MSEYKFNIGCQREIMVALHPGNSEVVICWSYTEQEMNRMKRDLPYTTITFSHSSGQHLLREIITIRTIMLDMVIKNKNFSRSNIQLATDVFIVFDSEKNRVKFQRMEDKHSIIDSIELKPIEMDNLFSVLKKLGELRALSRR